MLCSAGGEFSGAGGNTATEGPLKGVTLHSTGLEDEERSRLYAQLQGLGAQVARDMKIKGEVPDILVAVTTVSAKYRVRVPVA